MVRYMVAASVAFAMISGVALAEPAGSVTTVTRTDQGKTISKRFINHRGDLVTKRKVVRNGIAGTTVSRSRTITNGDGDSVTRTRTTIR